MRRWLIRLGVLVCVVLALIAGVLVGHHNGLICFSQGSGGPPTTTTGPVTLSTDHSVYAPSDPISVTLTNHLNAPIKLVPAVAGETCPLFIMGKQGYGAVTPCQEAGEAPPSTLTMTVPANGTSGDLFNSPDDPLDNTPLTDGTYQVSATWLAGPFPPTYHEIQHFTSIASQPFRVCSCRIC